MLILGGHNLARNRHVLNLAHTSLYIQWGRIVMVMEIHGLDLSLQISCNELHHLMAVSSCCTLRCVAVFISKPRTLPRQRLGIVEKLEPAIYGLHGSPIVGNNCSGSLQCPGWDFLRAIQQCEIPPTFHSFFLPSFPIFSHKCKTYIMV